ncbi:MAG TPA: aspartate carbamoyltransferase regulatory subunit [Porphyromonadaceae bacterium]|nr:aspartate carbamoyltransferase regulatory subunit [Porphyromonadaceae bacterium]
MEKKELQVVALENGTVIDHIPSEVLFKVVELLGLDKAKESITIGNNLIGKKERTKGIIKISNRFFEEKELSKIALVAPSAIINIIKNFEVIDKKQVTLPDEIKGIIRCGNPKCISNNEPMSSIMDVIDKEEVEVKCRYCEHTFRKNEIEII